MESRGPEDSINVKTSQAYFLKGSSHFKFLPDYYYKFGSERVWIVREVVRLNSCAQRRVKLTNSSLIGTRVFN